MFGNSIPGHTTGEPKVGFELATNSFLFYGIANLYKTSLHSLVPILVLFKFFRSFSKEVPMNLKSSDLAADYLI